MRWRSLTRRTCALSLPLGLTFCSNPAGNVSTPGAAPVAVFTIRCTDLSCSFTDGSSDPDGTIVTRNWDFGDGGTSAEVNPEHSYAQSGTYSVSLRVVDDSGATSSSSQSMVVRDAANGSFVFMGAGDIADCSSGAEDAATAAIIAKDPTATVFTLGDNAYPDGSPNNYSQCYNPTWGMFRDRTHPAPGNHDYHASGAPGYFGYFGAIAGPSGRGYYSYDLGSWHIISLDSEIDVKATSPQAVWLKQDLADHPATCTLAYWHRPLFTSGAVHPPAVAMRPLFTILYDAGADIVVSGHNHQYERFAPQRPDGTADAGAGVRYFVAGTGGAGLYSFTTAQPNSEARYKGFGVLRLTLGATNYAWEFVPIAGSNFTDQGTGACH
jgi:acid phosphatase type 7